jgi:hypothetical protein
MADEHKIPLRTLFERLESNETGLTDDEAFRNYDTWNARMKIFLRAVTWYSQVASSRAAPAR